jgi:magnesium transporter
LKKLRTEVWVHCINPSRDEIKELSTATEVPEEDFRRALDEDERPTLSDFDGYSVITFHAPYLNKNSDYVTVPFNIIIKNNIIILLRKKAIESLENLDKLDDKKKIETLEKDITYTIYMILSEVVDHFFSATDGLEEQVDKIEELVFKKQSERTVKEIFALKKTLIYFHKSLTGNREVITGIEKQFLKEIKGRNIKKFRYLYNDVIQLIDMISTYRDILTNSLDIYLTSVSNNLNEVMKRLTVISAFVLVPTLISGIYGMNFRYMPEINKFGIYGYPFALGLMVLSTLFIYLYFKKKQWI